MMKRAFSVVFLASLLFAAACNNSDKGDRMTDEALLNTSPFDRITDSIEEFPKDASLYTRRAELLSQHDKHELASADFGRAWKLRHDESTALLYTTSLFLAGREKEAIALLKEAEQTFLNQPEFARRLSEAYLQSGQPAAALKQFDALLARDSTNFEAWYEKGVIMAEQKDTPRAVGALERAYALQPIQTYGVTLANMYAETKNEKTIAICDQLIARDTLQELTDAIFIKGIFYANTSRPEQALEQFELCIRRDWKFVEAYIEKGIILYHQQNIDEALKTFALATKVSNTHPDAYFWMGKCFETMGNKEEARESYRRALAFDRRFAEAAEGLERLK